MNLSKMKRLYSSWRLKTHSSTQAAHIGFVTCCVNWYIRYYQKSNGITVIFQPWCSVQCADCRHQTFLTHKNNNNNNNWAEMKENIEHWTINVCIDSSRCTILYSFDAWHFGISVLNCISLYSIFISLMLIWRIFTLINSFINSFIN